MSGLGTTHCTNGIIIQKECDWCENIDEASRNVSNGRKARTLKLSSVNDLEPFNVGKRFGPPSLSDVSVESNFEQMQHNSIKRDFCFILSRMAFENSLFTFRDTEQSVSAWTDLI